MNARTTILLCCGCALAIACGSSSPAGGPGDAVPDGALDVPSDVAATEADAVEAARTDADDTGGIDLSDADAAGGDPAGTTDADGTGTDAVDDDATPPGDADAAGPGDTTDAPDVEVTPRTLVFNPLFGDTLPQNLLLDPNFSVRMPGLGDWQATTLGTLSTSAPSFGSWPMSDSPSGIALNVAHLADASGTTLNVNLVLMAQVPGGPGPFHVGVWVSTLDAAASATLSGVSIGVLTSVTGGATFVAEDPAKARVIAGRTWHRFDGVIAHDLTLGGFVAFEFVASRNTWLLQGPQFAPVALETPADAGTPVPRGFRTPRALTPEERRAIVRYVRQPRLSVPPSHPALRDPDQDLPPR